jgi:phosphate starvation-inducible PhoH-like protein
VDVVRHPLVQEVIRAYDRFDAAVQAAKAPPKEAEPSAAASAASSPPDTSTP